MQQELANGTIDLGALPHHERLRVRIALGDLRRYEVAGLARISESMLSRILSGERDADPAIVARIDAAIDELTKAA